MAGKNGRIGFVLPEQQKPGKDAFSIKPNKLEEWVAQLPMGNVGETARLVFSALYETNRQQIGWKDRYRLLETLRPSVAYVGQALHKRFTGLTFPLPPKTQRIANLATELYNEMALGYKAAIEDMLSRHVLFQNKRALTVMLHRALRYLNRVLLTTYQVYSPQPKNTWSDLHMIYRHAEAHKLTQIAITDKEQTILPKTSIATAYKQALLLALATPYRLRQGEVSVVYAALELWAHLAQFQPYDAAANQDAALFVLQLNSNEEPSHLAFNHFSCDDGMCRLLNMERLTTTVHDELELIGQGAKTELKERLGNGLNVDLLRRLAVTWGIPPKRGFYRSTKAAKVELVIGLTAVHRALGLVSALRSISTLNTTPAAGAEDLFAKTSTFSSRTVKSINDKKDDVWQLFRPQAKPQPSSQTQSGPKTTPLEMQTWEVRDESSGGFRIARSGADTLGVQVGDIIGVRPLTDTHDANWIIAVVRWIRQSGGNELEMGVQNLAHRCLPAAARLHQGRHTSEYQRIIGLPETKEPPHPQSVLVPALIFNVGNTLQVNLEGHEHDIILTGMLENTGSFAQFTFDNVNQPQAASSTHTAEKNSALPSDFNSLWSEL